MNVLHYSLLLKYDLWQEEGLTWPCNLMSKAWFRHCTWAVSSLHSLTTPVLACFKPIGPRPMRWNYNAARILLHSPPIVVLLCCCHPPPSPSPLCCLYVTIHQGGLFLDLLIFCVCFSLMLEAESASPRFINSAKVEHISIYMDINKCSSLIKRMSWLNYYCLDLEKNTLWANSGEQSTLTQ